jgi:hypothetical protein
MAGSRPCGAAGAGAPRPRPLGAGGVRRAVGTSTRFSPSRRRAPSLLLSPPPSLPTPATSSCWPRPKLRATPSAAAALPAAGRCWPRRRRAGKEGAASAAEPAEYCRRCSGRRRPATPGRRARAAGRGRRRDAGGRHSPAPPLPPPPTPRVVTTPAAPKCAAQCGRGVSARRTRRQRPWRLRYRAGKKARRLRRPGRGSILPPPQQPHLALNPPRLRARWRGRGHGVSVDGARRRAGGGDSGTAAAATRQ